MNHEPEDLLREVDLCSLEAGEQVRMMQRVQSSGSIQALGIFLFESMGAIPFHLHTVPCGRAADASSLS